MNDVMNFMNHGGGVDNLWVSGLALVLDLHDCAPIMAISAVCHILNTAIREGNLGGQQALHYVHISDVTHLVFPDNVPLAVSGPVLTVVGVVMVVVDPVLEAEGVGLLVLA